MSDPIEALVRAIPRPSRRRAPSATTSDVVVLLGGPGSGKGTQALFLAGALGVPHLSSGDLLRAHRRKGTALGKQAQETMDQGGLVSDDLVTSTLLSELDTPAASTGAVLDGFSRTLPQAQALDRALAERGRRVSAVILLDVPPTRLVERVSGRRVCPACGASYHLIFNPPHRVGRTCDRRGGLLEQRQDDYPDVIAARVDAYRVQTVPLLDYYEARGFLRRVDGVRTIGLIRADVLRTGRRLASPVSQWMAATRPGSSLSERAQPPDAPTGLPSG